MARQDIYGSVEDNLGRGGHTSRCRGVKSVKVWINTDLVSELNANFVYDKTSQGVHGYIEIPKEWDIEIKRT